MLNNRARNPDAEGDRRYPGLAAGFLAVYTLMHVLLRPLILLVPPHVLDPLSR